MRGPRPSRSAQILAVIYRLAPLACIVALAVVLRFDGLPFGLPNPNARPDESVIVHKALRFGSGDLNPHYFKYPSLFFYVVFFEYGLYYVWGHLTGLFPSPAAMERAFYQDPSTFYLLARVATALAGVATVPALYLLGCRLYSRRVGLVAAALLAGAYLHVRNSHFGVTDVPATFFAVAAMAVMARSARGTQHAARSTQHAARGTERSDPRAPRTAHRALTLAGVLCGLAASTKYNLGVVIFPLVVAALQHAARSGTARSTQHAARSTEPRCARQHGARSPTTTVPVPLRAARCVLRAPLPLRAACCALCAASIAFAVTSPFVLLDAPAALRDLAWQSAYLRAGHAGRTDLGLGFGYQALFSLRHGLGLPLAVAAGCGILLMLRRRQPADWLVLSFALPYYLAIGAGHTVFVRYMVPLVPTLCLAAAVAVEWVASRRLGTRSSRLAAAAGVFRLAQRLSGLTWVMPAARPPVNGGPVLSQSRLKPAADPEPAREAQPPSGGFGKEQAPRLRGDNDATTAVPDYSACALVGLRPGSFSLRASLLTILLLAPSLASTLAANRLLAREDTRVLAATWMARHAPAGSGVLMLGTHYSLPALRPTRDTVLASMQKAKGLRQEERTTPGASCYAERLANVLIESSPAERLVVADSGKNKPLVCSPPPAYRLFRLGDRGPELARRLAISRSDDLLAAGIDFVVITEHPFDRAPLPQPVLDALRRAGTTCYEVAPGRPDGAQGPIYDPIDAFFLPYAGFEGVERPGPTIRIVSLHSAFRRSCR